MIFCVEDDNGIRNMMLYTLKASGFDVEGFSEGTALFEALQEKTPELIMLDIMLPGDDGITILSRLRAQTATADIPIIMATAKGTEYDKVIGLDMGADDYLAKPFGMMEMVSRVKAVLRRVQRAPIEDVYQAGGISLSLKERLVKVDQEPIQLSYKEFELLKVFMEHPGEVFTRQWLYERIWNGTYSEKNRTVDIHVQTLRKKLGTCGSLIESVKYIGYRIKKVP